MEIRCGGLLFTSKFDSGNLAQVERVEHTDSDSDNGNGATPLYGCTLTPDYEFNVWTKPDGAGTPFENGNRSWFYFGVRGYSPNKLIKINIVNLNRQGKLYSQGMSPLVKTVPAKPKWERVRDRPHHHMVDGQFTLSFTHRFMENRGGTTYFAFCYPWSYNESQDALQLLDDKYKDCVHLHPGEMRPSDIYYHRELVCHSIDRKRIDLITVSACNNMTWQREPRLDKLFPEKFSPRAHRFYNKRIYFVSSRVHPGETPASFVFNGFLKFILRENDPRAAELRKRFVFKLIPMLNPDGVSRGHYRTDQRGVNLNRVYLNPDPEYHSGIFAARSLILFYHRFYRLVRVHEEPGAEGKAPGSLKLREAATPEEKSAMETKSSPDECEEINKRLDAELRIDEIRRDMAHPPASLYDIPPVAFKGDCLDVKPRDSGVAFYVDLHGHASKRGCFIYGNHLENEEDQVNNLLFPKLISLNTAHFDFNGCNFTERNMYLKDKRDGMSKEGSGRVAMFKAAGLVHSYTLECNYNTGRTVNCIPPAVHDNGRATPPPPAGFPPKYTMEIFEEVGRAMAVAALDMIQANPWSRLQRSEFTTFENLRNWMLRYVRSSCGNPILPRKMARISTRMSGTSLAVANNNGAGGGPGNHGNGNGGSNVGGGAGMNNLRNSRSESSKPPSSTFGSSRYSTNATATGSNRLAPVKNGVSAATLAAQARQASQSGRPGDAMKRQRNLIRAAVNGNQKVGGSNPATAGAMASQGYHVSNGDVAHHLPNVANQLLMQNGGHATAAIRLSTGSNSDGEASRDSPTRSSAQGFESFYGTGEQVGNFKMPAAGPRPTLARNQTFPRAVTQQSRSNLWPGAIGKPQGSKIPVRSPAKGLITSQATKQPSLSYRGRSPTANNARSTPNGSMRSSAVGSGSNLSQVVIGPGGTISIPVNQAPSRFYNSIPPTPHNESLRASLNGGSTYLSNGGSVDLGMQPLFVSQKPLLLAPPRDEGQYVPNPDRYTPASSTFRKSASDGKLTSKLPARSARKSGKGKFGKKKSGRASRGSKTPVKVAAKREIPDQPDSRPHLSEAVESSVPSFDDRFSSVRLSPPCEPDPPRKTEFDHNWDLTAPSPTADLTVVGQTELELSGPSGYYATGSPVVERPGSFNPNKGAGLDDVTRGRESPLSSILNSFVDVSLD